MKNTIKNAIKKAAKKAKSIAQGFKTETLKKVIGLLKAAINHYKTEIEKGTFLKVSISTGNVKIGHVMNVSLAPVLTCGPMCKFCIRICYDIKACLQYPNVLLARARNTALALYNRKEYFAQIEKAIQRRKANFYFRWHVGGDIPDYDYFDNMVRIAKTYKHFTFWTYTKQYHIVNKWIAENGNLPDNLCVMFSEWKTKDENGNIIAVPFLNPYKMPVFSVRFQEEAIPQNVFKCPGNCNICKEHKTGCIGKQDTYADAH